MNQYNRLLDPKKDIGRYSGTLAIYLLVMTLVTVLWEVLLGLYQKRSKSSNGETQCPECLGRYSLSYLYFHWTLSL